jgi:hypothetical protein
LFSEKDVGSLYEMEKSRASALGVDWTRLEMQDIFWWKHHFTRKF